MTTPAPVDTRLRIETPESVRLEFRLAGLPSRMGAWAIDVGVAWATFLVVSILVGFLGLSAVAPDVTTGFVLLGLFFIQWGYFWLFEAFWGGRTPGKRAMGLRVMNVAGYPVGFYDAMLRNLVRAADFLPAGYAVGLVSVLFSPRMQRLGDIAAGTVVVREERKRKRRSRLDLEGVEALPRAGMAGGWRPSDRTLIVVERFVLRATSLGRARADEIAGVLAGPLAERLGWRDLEEADPVREPRLFLMRVLRTFGDFEPDEPSSIGARWRRRPGTRGRSVAASGASAAGGGSREQER